MAQSLNHPDPHEAFLLSDLKEKKITYEKDAKTLNAATFTVNKEDHTLGNMLVHQLLRDPRVLFAGYRVPHPLEYHFLLRIQVKEGYTPQEALSTAIEDCISTVNHMQSKFKDEVERIRQEEGQQDQYNIMSNFSSM
eukprot:m.74105 g.74105  ORF g.74105 m.74105 type:complete len:137 (-) comp16147_c0_seq2:332-742(-)